MNGDPRIVREPELEKEQSAFAVSTKLLDELEANRRRIGTTQGDSQAREAEKARLAAEQQAIINRVNNSQSQHKSNFLDEQINTQRGVLRGQGLSSVKAL
jgi:hypothetical protein